MNELMAGIALILIGFCLIESISTSNCEDRFLLFFQLLLFAILVISGVITCFMAAISLGA